MKKLPETASDTCPIEGCRQLGTNRIGIVDDETGNLTDYTYVYYKLCDKHYDELMRNYYKKGKRTNDKMTDGSTTSRESDRSL